MLAKSEIGIFEGTVEQSVIQDWNHTTDLLGMAQKIVWDYTITTAAALEIVDNVKPNSKAKVKLVQDFAVEQDTTPSLEFSTFMLEKSKFTNVLQPFPNNLSGAHAFKLTAPIQIYLPPSEQGSKQRNSAKNEAMNTVSFKMEYNQVKISFNNMVGFWFHYCKVVETFDSFTLGGQTCRCRP